MLTKTFKCNFPKFTRAFSDRNAWQVPTIKLDRSTESHKEIDMQTYKPLVILGPQGVGKVSYFLVGNDF